MKIKKSNKVVTLKDIALKAGVSVATVSNVMNNRTEEVGEKACNNVRKIAKQMGYRPNRAAQAMRTGKTRTLGLVLPDLLNPFFPQMAQAFENIARELGYSIFLVETRLSLDIEREGIESLIQQGVDGVFWFPRSQKDTIRGITSRVPVVVLDRELSDYDIVRPDHEAGGRLQSAHLLEKGHRKAGIISGPLSVDNMRLRRDAFVQAFSKKGRITWEMENPFSMEITSSNKKQLTKGKPTAIVAGNDMIAVGVIRSLSELGIAVPEQVSVIGFDNIPWCTVVSPTLTTIQMQLKEIAAEAVNLLLRRMRDPDTAKRKIIIDVGLVCRESVAQI